ncbi:serpin B13 isoform X2 [Suncus etruscus]|uniref:serpin B13 isoform X2 n=1 Tax=Suncus etruscus TaxID=109475 RepID=UPI00210FCAC6|nr:serpin B13 isoform X2 [Suncus etruscus]
MDSLDAPDTQFGFDLFKRLNNRKNGNIFFSPVGMSTAVGMLLLGSERATSTPLQKMLFSEKDTSSNIKMQEKDMGRHKTKESHHQLQRLSSDLSKPTSDYELKIANRLFGEKTHLFLQKYLDYVEKYFHASLEPVDFLNATDESRKKINSWVESQTNEKIKDLFSDGSLNSSTKLVVVNIVHFKGQWDREFKKEDTIEEEFWLSKSLSKSVPMMTQCQSFSFTSLENLPAKILGIPYKNNDLSMFVLLPDDIDGLEKIIDIISPENLVEWTRPGNMEQRAVCVHLPRFQVEDSYDLEAVLGVLRENCARDSEHSSHLDMHIQKFLHKSFLVVTEDGTEAGASTGVDFTVNAVPGYENFICNHPFLFFIKHRDSDSVLFFGRFSIP